MARWEDRIIPTVHLIPLLSMLSDLSDWLRYFTKGRFCDVWHVTSNPMLADSRTVSCSPRGRGDQAPHTEHEDGQIHERLERGPCPVHPIVQPTEALEPAERAFNDVALPLQHGVLGV